MTQGRADLIDPGRLGLKATHSDSCECDEEVLRCLRFQLNFHETYIYVHLMEMQLYMCTSWRFNEGMRVSLNQTLEELAFKYSSR